MPLDVTTRPQIQSYASWQRGDLVARLGEVVSQLVSLLQDYYRMQGDEVRTKAEAWMSSGETTVTGRQRDVDLSTYHVTASILSVRGDIESLKAEREYLLILLGEVR